MLKSILTWLALTLGLNSALARAEAEPNAARAARAGELTTIRNQKVLRLFGSDVRERGFAHGYLLADEIIRCLDGALTSLPGFGSERYHDPYLPWALSKLDWDAEARLEMQGIFEGMLAKKGEAGLRSQALGRVLKAEDIVGINAIGDWFGPGCSAYTAWGARTTQGQVIHGRNLDFPLGGDTNALQVVLVQAALPERPAQGDRPALPTRQAWIGVGWPGLSALYSGMNQHGLVVCLHDAENVAQAGARREGLLPRGILLRRMLEELDPAQGWPVPAARAMAAAKPSTCGNLFHLSWPQAATPERAPCAVLEFDGIRPETDHLDSVAVVEPERKQGYFILTNHMRNRQPAVACYRYEAFQRVFTGMAEAGKVLERAQAGRVLVAGEFETSRAMHAHSLVFYPESLELDVALGQNNVPSTRVPMRSFTWKELAGDK